MRKGRNVITIGYDDFINGVASSNEALDGAFSADSIGLNPIIERGLMYGTETGTNDSTTVVGHTIATADDANASGNDKYYLSVDNSSAIGTGDGKFYTNNGGTITLRYTDSTKSYQLGTSDMVQYKLSTYATSTNDIIKLDGTDLTSAQDPDWWSTVGSPSNTALETDTRHPLLVFEDTLYIGDHNMIHTWDGTTGVDAVLDLADENYIVALGIDSVSGNMLISTTNSQNYSGTQGSQSKVWVWDGFSNKALRVYEVDEMITSFQNTGGITYVFTPTSVGYWNGTGISFLRPLNISPAGDTLVYKHKAFAAENMLFYVEGEIVMALIPVIPGKPAFYPIYNASDDIDTIGYLGDSHIMASIYDSTSTVRDVNLMTSGFMGTLKSRKYIFDRQIILRSVKIETGTDINATNSPYTVSFRDETNTPITVTCENNTTGAVRFVEGTANNRRVRSFQIQLSGSQGFHGLRQVEITYDFAE